MEWLTGGAARFCSVRGRHWANLEPVGHVVGHEQGNTRPVLILSNDEYNEGTQLVIAALITTQGADRPWVVPIQSVPMPQKSWVLASQIRTLSVGRLETLIGTMSEDEMLTVLNTLYLTISRPPRYDGF